MFVKILIIRNPLELPVRQNKNVSDQYLTVMEKVGTSECQRVDGKKNSKILENSGNFDCFGIMVSSMITFDEKKLTPTTPNSFNRGLAIFRHVGSSISEIWNPNQ